MAQQRWDQRPPEQGKGERYPSSCLSGFSFPSFALCWCILVPTWVSNSTSPPGCMLVPEPDPMSWPIKVINSFRSPLFLVRQESQPQADHHAAYGVSCVSAALCFVTLSLSLSLEFIVSSMGSACGSQLVTDKQVPL